MARLSGEDKDNPEKVKAARKKEFDKEAVDHENLKKAVGELRRLKRKNSETPAQLAWRIEKRMRKAYPELCGSKDEAAKKTHLQMLQDTLVVMFPKYMCPVPRQAWTPRIGDLSRGLAVIVHNVVHEKDT